MVFITKQMLEDHLDTQHMDTEVGEIKDTPTTDAELKTTQIHCCLNHDTECSFQCNTKEELNKHIEKHNNKKQIQCTACTLYFRNIDDLSEHMNKTHKKVSSYQNAVNVIKTSVRKKN